MELSLQLVFRGITTIKTFFLLVSYAPDYVKGYFGIPSTVYIFKSMLFDYTVKRFTEQAQCNNFIQLFFLYRRSG